MWGAAASLVPVTAKREEPTRGRCRAEFQGWGRTPCCFLPPQAMISIRLSVLRVQPHLASHGRGRRLLQGHGPGESRRLLQWIIVPQDVASVGELASTQSLESCQGTQVSVRRRGRSWRPGPSGVTGQNGALTPGCPCVLPNLHSPCCLHVFSGLSQAVFFEADRRKHVRHAAKFSQCLGLGCMTAALTRAPNPSPLPHCLL